VEVCDRKLDASSFCASPGWKVLLAVLVSHQMRRCSWITGKPEAEVCRATGKKVGFTELNQQ